MKKVILVTGATDGIGLVTAKSLAADGHTVLLHGRNESKLGIAKAQLLDINPGADIETYQADLSVLGEVKALGQQILEKHRQLDVLINNAGVYVVPQTVSQDGLDVRFAVNTISPYLLTRLLLPALGSQGRGVNLSSAAQAPVTVSSLLKPSTLSDGAVYAQSKLAITMWTEQLARSLGETGPIIVAVNPASMLGSKMVQQAYGVAGGDLNRGADILIRASFSAEFADASGQYFDNDIGQFRAPHPDARNAQKNHELMETLDKLIGDYL